MIMVLVEQYFAFSVTLLALHTLRDARCGCHPLYYKGQQIDKRL